MPIWVQALALGLPIVISLAAVVYARRSAVSSAASAEAARQTARVDRDSWHAQRTPRLEVRLELKGSRGFEVPGIALENVGVTECEQVDVTLEAAAGTRQAITAFKTHSGGWLGPWTMTSLRHGDVVWHEVLPADPHGGRTMVRCVCRGNGGEVWTVRLPLDLPSLAAQSREHTQDRYVVDGG